jgi:transcription initiation factor TFIID subunit 6
VAFKPSVKHIVSKELILYFDKIQAAILDDNPDEEVVRLRQAALASVRDDPGLHQLIPYFVTFTANQVTQYHEDTFVLRQMMELLSALIANKTLFLDPYASPMAAQILTCMMGRKLGREEGIDAVREQYQLREFSASLIGKLAKKYSSSNAQLRTKLTRTCLKFFLDPTKPAPVLYGAISGLSAAGGPEAVRILVLKNLKDIEAGILRPLREKGDNLDFEMLVGGIVKAITTLVDNEESTVNTMNGGGISDRDVNDLNDFVGSIIGERIASLGNRRLVKEVLEGRLIGD